MPVGSYEFNKSGILRPTMTTVEIEYCVPCGFLDRAEEVQHELLSTFGGEIDE